MQKQPINMESVSYSDESAELTSESAAPHTHHPLYTTHSAAKQTSDRHSRQLAENAAGTEPDISLRSRSRPKTKLREDYWTYIH